MRLADGVAERTSPLDEAELRRLDVLDRLCVLGSEPEAAFDDLTRLAAQLCDAPMASVTLVDRERQWFKSRLGLTACENPRDVSFCARAVEQLDTLVVEDAHHDPRFRDNPLVTGAPFLRFYAGVPLIIDNAAVGTLCVLDVEPRILSALQFEQLHMLARQAAGQLELRRDRLELQAQLSARVRAEAAERQSLGRFRTLFDQSPIGMAECQPDGTILTVNSEFARMLGYDRATLMGTAPAELLADPADAGAQRADLDALRNGNSYTTRRDFRHAGGHVVSTQIGVSAFRAEDGSLSRLLVTVTDITDRVRAEQELSVTHEELRRRQIFTDAVLDSVAVGIVACDADGELTVFNRTSQTWHGMDIEDGEAEDGDGLASRFDLYDEDGSTLSEDRIPLLRALRDGSVTDAEIVISPHHLPATRVQCSGRAMVDADGRLLGAVVAMADITQSRVQQAALQASETRFRATFDNDPAGLAVLNDAAVLVQANKAFARILGLHDPSQCEGAEIADLFGRAARTSLAEMIVTATQRPGEPFSSEQQLVTASGEQVWCLLTVIDLPDPQTGRCTLLQAEDITVRRENEQRLTRQALTDSLTGLPNRLMLLDRVATAIARLDRHPAEHVFALFCDLNGFKAVNDAYGHETGDHLLVQIADRLRSTVRPTDTVARLGGDEFVILCEELTGPDDVDTVAHRIADTIAEPVVVDGHELTVTASIGIARARATTSAEELLRHADAAMYQAKSLRRSQRESLLAEAD